MPSDDDVHSIMINFINFPRYSWIVICCPLTMQLQFYHKHPMIIPWSPCDFVIELSRSKKSIWPYVRWLKNMVSPFQSGWYYPQFSTHRSSAPEVVTHLDDHRAWRQQPGHGSHLLLFSGQAPWIPISTGPSLIQFKGAKTKMFYVKFYVETYFGIFWDILVPTDEC